MIICDPLVGAWSDRRESSIGRIPFLVGGAIATSIGFVLLFNLPAMGSPMPPPPRRARCSCWR
ncbi:MFS transporter [Novosphingobium resinovorum]